MIVDFIPGVVNELSRRRNQANWRETHLMRWEGSTMLPVGGWTMFAYEDFGSPIRATHKWTDNSGAQHIAYLCEQHCYVDSGDGLQEITPADGITPPVAIGSGGYGDDVFGTDDYGEPRTGTERLNFATPAYTLGNWGEDLRVMTSADGRLLGWSPSAPSDLLTAVENAPIGNRSFVITPERFVILFGAGGYAQQFMWCDEENDTEWTPSETTQAGGYYVEPSSPIMAQHLTSSGTLFFTAQSSYIIRSVGLPFVYGYDRITDCPPPYSPASIVEIPNGSFWFAMNGFWLYNGVSSEPVDCPLWDWIASRINVTRTRYRAAMINVAPKYEVWLFFVSGDDNADNNTVVIYNYKEKRWSMGSLGRTCGFSIPNDPNPVMADNNFVYRHEDGYNYSGTSMPWAETHTMNTAGGGRLTTVKQMLPEINGNYGAVQFKFAKRDNPTSGPETMSSAKTIRSNGYVDVRETARDFRLRIEMVQPVSWSFGPVDMDMVTRGTK